MILLNIAFGGLGTKGAGVLRNWDTYGGGVMVRDGVLALSLSRWDTESIFCLCMKTCFIDHLGPFSLGVYVEGPGAMD